jgi:hypothetical protein
MSNHKSSRCQKKKEKTIIPRAEAHGMVRPWGLESGCSPPTLRVATSGKALMPFSVGGPQRI